MLSSRNTEIHKMIYIEYRMCIYMHDTFCNITAIIVEVQLKLLAINFQA